MSKCIVYDMTAPISKEIHKTGWFPYEPEEFIRSRKLGPILEGCTYTENGIVLRDNISADALAEFEKMFPGGRVE